MIREYVQRVNLLGQRGSLQKAFLLRRQPEQVTKGRYVHPRPTGRDPKFNFRRRLCPQEESDRLPPDIVLVAVFLYQNK